MSSPVRLGWCFLNCCSGSVQCKLLCNWARICSYPGFFWEQCGLENVVQFCSHFGRFCDDSWKGGILPVQPRIAASTSCLKQEEVLSNCVDWKDCNPHLKLFAILLIYSVYFTEIKYEPFQPSAFAFNIFARWCLSKVIQKPFCLNGERSHLCLYWYEVWVTSVVLKEQNTCIILHLKKKLLKGY